jgi:hypothetical protein
MTDEVERLRAHVADVMMFEHNFDAGKLLDSLIAAAHAAGVDEERRAFMSDVLPHCATCIQAWSMGMKYTIDFSAKGNK